MDDGAVLAVHFRMTGDWDATRTSEARPRFTRIALDTDDGQRLSLVDSRALCSATYYPPGKPPRLVLGPEPDELTGELLREATVRRALAIKSVLLDQRVVAGLGNIYAAEALWRSRINPACSARALSDAQLRALVRAIKAAIADGFARQGRYRDGRRERPFKVYDREGHPCCRCRTPIARITQSGRSTCFCPSCQRTA
jgi:formamidopyrimidine-DNA glycosylase